MALSIDSENTILHVGAFILIVLILVTGVYVKQSLPSSAAEPTAESTDSGKFGSIDMPDKQEADQKENDSDKEETTEEEATEEEATEEEATEEEATEEETTEEETTEEETTEEETTEEETTEEETTEEETTEEETTEEETTEEETTEEETTEEETTEEETTEEETTEEETTEEDNKNTDQTPGDGEAENSETSKPRPKMELPDELKPTVMEELVKPVSQLNHRQIKQRIFAYRTWVKEGEIKVQFDYRKIPNEKMHHIVEHYYLTSKRHMFRFDQYGENAEALNEKPNETGLIIGLSRFQSEWPAKLKEFAKERMGRLERHDFVVQDRVALELYRCLGRLGNHNDLQGKTIDVTVSLKGEKLVATASTNKNN